MKNLMIILLLSTNVFAGDGTTIEIVAKHTMQSPLITALGIEDNNLTRHRIEELVSEMKGSPYYSEMFSDLKSVPKDIDTEISVFLDGKNKFLLNKSVLDIKSKTFVVDGKIIALEIDEKGFLNYSKFKKDFIALKSSKKPQYSYLNFLISTAHADISLGDVAFEAFMYGMALGSLISKAIDFVWPDCERYRDRITRNLNQSRNACVEGYSRLKKHGPGLFTPLFMDSVVEELKERNINPLNALMGWNKPYCKSQLTKNAPQGLRWNSCFSDRFKEQTCEGMQKFMNCLKNYIGWDPREEAVNDTSREQYKEHRRLLIKDGWIRGSTRE